MIIGIETARLIQWLKAMGHTDSDAVSCIMFMATGTGLPSDLETKEEKENTQGVSV